MLNNNLKTSFQAGVDSVYNAIVAKGTTPASKSLSDVVKGINKISASPILLASNSGNATVSCTSLPNYQSLTTNNFLIKINSINSASGSYGDGNYMRVDINTYISFNTPSISYNNSTGIVTISGMTYSYSSSKWWAGGPQYLWSGSSTYNWSLYLV